jgi:MOSC domain-containing protein YiiM
LTTGRVVAVNISTGGVPKLPVERAFLSANGLEGDRHDDRVHHGGPLRAVCLFSDDVIAALRAEGHPIFAGAAGENVTVSGVSWTDVVPGSRWEIGEEAEVEVTGYTTPCYKNAGWFSGGQFTRISQSRHPGFARVYARVLVEGSIAPGDQFTRTD